MNPRVRLGLALRLARRELRRNPRRHVFVIVLVFLPSLLTIIGFTAVATHDRSETHRSAVEPRTVVSDGVWWTSRDWLAGTTPHPSGHGPLPIRMTWYGADEAPAQEQLASSFRLLDGRRPEGPDEVMITAAAADELGLRVDDRAELGSSDGSVQVVGIGVRRADAREVAAMSGPGFRTMSGSYVEWHDPSDRQQVVVQEIRVDARTGSLVVLGLSVVAVLTATLTSVAFAVASRRQLRTIGLLGSAGGDPATIRASLVLQGLVPGLVGAGLAVAVVAGLVLIGNTVDLSALVPIGVAPGTEGLTTLERLTGREGAILTFSWVGASATLLLGTVSGALAAWFPARTVSRMPVLTALGARRPLPPLRREVPLGGFALAVVGLVILGFWASSDRAAELAFALPLALGFLIVGAIGIATALIAAVGRLADHVPGIGRIALRDLTRGRGQTVGAVVAVAACLAIPIGILTVLNTTRSAVPDCCADERWLQGDVQTDADGRASTGFGAVFDPGSELLVIEVGSIEPVGSIIQNVLDRPAARVAVSSYLSVDGSWVRIGRIDPDEAEGALGDAAVSALRAGRVLSLSDLGTRTTGVVVGFETIPVETEEIPIRRGAFPYDGLDLVAPTDVVPPPSRSDAAVADFLLREGSASAGENGAIAALMTEPTLQMVRLSSSVWGGASTESVVTRQRDPSHLVLWEGASTDLEWSEPTRRWWRDPRFAGPLVAALIATAVASIALVLRDLDRHTDRRAALAAGADPRRLRRLTVIDAVIVVMLGAVLAVPLGWAPIAVIWGVDGLPTDPGMVVPGVPSPGLLVLAVLVPPVVLTALLWSGGLGAASILRRSDRDLLPPRT